MACSFPQRFEELKFLLNMETDPIKKQKRMDEIEMFLKTPLEVIDLCDTSSDEEEIPEQVSIVVTLGGRKGKSKGRGKGS